MRKVIEHLTEYLAENLTEEELEIIYETHYGYEDLETIRIITSLTIILIVFIPSLIIYYEYFDNSFLKSSLFALSTTTPFYLTTIFLDRTLKKSLQISKTPKLATKKANLIEEITLK